MPQNIRVLYSLYTYIRKADLATEKKRNLFRELLRGEEWSWRVVGISVAALHRFKENDFRKPRGIDRDHITPFAETSRRMLDTLMTEDEWCRLVYENEEVRLVTKQEHRTRKVSRVVQIDFELGYFRNKPVSYMYRIREEGEFLRNLALTELVS